MELWDVYNVNREKTGKTIDRDSCEILQEGEYHLVTEAIIINSKQEILISKRAKSKTKYPLMWECNGGSVKSGEDTLQVILRELKEELGIVFNKDEAVFYKTIRDDKAKDFKDIWIFRKDIDLMHQDFTLYYQNQTTTITNKMLKLYLSERSQYNDNSLYKYNGFYEI